MYMCGRVIDQESEQLCICVLGLSIRKVSSYAISHGKLRDETHDSMDSKS
jgi:hypothetical protein